MHHVGRLNAARQRQLMGRLRLTVDAALDGGLPIHLRLLRQASRTSRVGCRPEPAARTSTRSARSDHPGPNPACRRSSQASAGRSLIVCGFWLETTVTFLVLPALASGFEVFVLMDATPAREDTAARPATDRLLHAGAVPITTRQLIAEWIEASSRARCALGPLISGPRRLKDRARCPVVHVPRNSQFRQGAAPMIAHRVRTP